MEEEEEEAWRSLKRGILELEEEGGSWRESAKEHNGDKYQEPRRHQLEPL